MAQETLVQLPAPTTSMVGRAREMARAKDLLWDPGVRLVSLLGFGGIGKTRLAIEIGWELHREPGFEDGIYFVDLAEIRDPELVPDTIARAIGILDMGAGNALERLCAAVRERDMLVVLDNFEQVTSAGAAVAELLAFAPRLSVLVTSRQPLRMRGEHRIEVPPLTASDAVELFDASARSVRATFELDSSTSTVVESICASLDGIPLAIELAAARCRVLSPADLQSRLDGSLALLSGGPDGQPERHRSMFAAILWSYEALSPPLQACLRQLSVFSGGWSLDGAEAVCSSGELAVMDALGALVDQHLIVRTERLAGTRFSMFETVRDFCRLQLETDPAAATAVSAHLAYCSALALDAEREISSADQVDWLDRVELEHDNIRSALAWSLDHDPQVALEIAAAMWRCWLLRGYASEGREWLERSVAAAPAGLSAARARALVGIGSMLEAIGHDAAAESRYREALDEWRQLDDRSGMATAYRHLGNSGLGRGLYDESIEWYRLAQALGEELDDQFVIAGVVSNLGSVAYFQGDYEEAERQWNEAATYFHASNDRHRLASVLNNLAELAAIRDDAARSVQLHDEVLELRRQLRDPIATAQTMINLGKAVYVTGDLGRARSLLEHALGQVRELGIERDLASCLYNLALVARAEGNAREAVELAGECLTIKVSTGERFDLAQCVELLGSLIAEQGMGFKGAQLLGAAGALRQQIGARPYTAEADARQFHESVRATLDTDRFEAALAEGTTWDLESAIAAARQAAVVPASTMHQAGTTNVVVELTPESQRLGLTARELEVLGFLAQRYTDREIAAALTISLRTVTTHVGRILTKLGVDGRRQAAAEAQRLGLLAS